MWGRARETDSGWVGAGPDDGLDRLLEAEEEPFDLRRSHVRTLLGPIEPAALGPTLVGEDLDKLGRSLDAADIGAGARDALAAELEDAYAAGIRGVVALARTTAALEDLRRLAGRSPLHLVAAAPPTVVSAAGDDSVGALLLDLNDGPGIEDVSFPTRKQSEGSGRCRWRCAAATIRPGSRRCGP